MKRSILMIGLLAATSLMAESRSLKWGEIENQWTPQVEQQYSQFIATLGKARERGLCTTTYDCIFSPQANPRYYQKNPKNLQIKSDCADLPFVLRAYFAWMNKLPFSYPSWPKAILPAELEKLALAIEGMDEKIEQAKKDTNSIVLRLRSIERQIAYKKSQLRNRSGDRGVLKAEIKELKRQRKGVKKEISAAEKNVKNLIKQKSAMQKEFETKSKKYAKRDIRYTPDGNRIVKRITVKPHQSINFVINDVNEKVSTASYRTRADRYDSGKNYRDFYPIKITRGAIKPGTVLYDPAGHIAVVYEVTNDGRIKLIDAHPDQSLTHITYGKKFSRSSILISGGFMNWRPIEQIGDEIIPTPNDQLEDYSLEQYTGTQFDNPDLVSYRKAEFILNGEKLDYYDFVRARLFKGIVRFNPLAELDARTDELCEDLHARAHAVEQAIIKQINLKKHPRKLPKNIYGTDGEWEEFSTPSRDARFKALFLETQSMVKKYLRMELNNDPKIEYRGDNLAWDMKKLYERKAKACKVNILLSEGRTATLDLIDIEKRLFELSFDPYHCVELRWGLTKIAESTPACKDRTKMKWYEAEQRLRNQINRDYRKKMDVTLFGLRHGKLGVKYRPSLNILKVISDAMY